MLLQQNVHMMFVASSVLAAVVFRLLSPLTAGVKQHGTLMSQSFQNIPGSFDNVPGKSHQSDIHTLARYLRSPSVLTCTNSMLHTAPFVLSCTCMKVGPHSIQNASWQCGHSFCSPSMFHAAPSYTEKGSAWLCFLRLRPASDSGGEMSKDQLYMS